MEKNDRKNFYKYISADVAKLIVENQNLKWSAPKLFNDPFDHRFNYLDIDINTFKEKIFKELNKLFFESKKPIDTTTETGKLLDDLRKNLKIPKNKFLLLLENASENIAKSIEKDLPLIEKDIENFLAKSRVLCLTEKNDNLLMWAHYGPSHEGAVMRLDQVDGMDLNLSLAKKVKYSTTFPSLATEQEWIDSFLCLNSLNTGERYYEAICTKSEDWSYEDEWRISIYEDSNEPYGYYYMRYPKKVFGAIYLGLKMSTETKTDILNLAKIHLPDMEIWDAAINKNTYKIDFKRIK